MDFHDTVLGHRFLEGTVPQLIRAIQGLSEEVKLLRKAVESKEVKQKAEGRRDVCESEGPYTEVRANYSTDDGFIAVDAWKTADDNEPGKTVAYVDSLTWRTLWIDNDARNDPRVVEAIREITKERRFK